MNIKKSPAIAELLKLRRQDSNLRPLASGYEPNLLIGFIFNQIPDKLSPICTFKFYFTFHSGNDWKQKVLNGKCLGKFTKNAIYKKGDNLFNFYREITSTGYNIPSYSLSLDVVTTDLDNSFSTGKINENDFNK